MSDELPKICPSCNGSDVTSFSSCRFCGTKYDAPKLAKASFPEMAINNNLGIIMLLGLLVGVFFLLNVMTHQQNQELRKPLAATIKAANRPRVLEFYADWCGPCRAYGPTVEACQAKYSGKVDFQRLNVDDPKSQELAQMCGVRSIPRTCIFDKDGNSVADFVGGTSAETLDGYMRKIVPN